MGEEALLAITDDTFKAEVIDSDVPVLVDFTATWCGPCKALAPILVQVAGEYEGRVKVVKVDVDAARETAMRYMVRSVPTLLLFNRGAVVEQSVGLVNAKKLKDMLGKVL